MGAISDSTPTAWWKADTLGLSDGVTVSSWTDATGNGYHAEQATVSYRPIFKTGLSPTGLDVLKFDGSRYFQANAGSLSASSATQTYAAVVWITPSNTNARTIVGPTASGGIHWYVNSTHKPELTKGGIALIGTATAALPQPASSTDYSAGKWAVVFVENVDTTSYRFERDGAADNNGTHSVTLTGGMVLTIGGYGTTNLFMFDGLIGEVVRWNRLLDSTERAAVQSELSIKWITPAGGTAAVAATLPALTASTAGLVTIPAAVAATLPALTASATATSTVTGVIGATLPALSAAVDVTADDTSLAVVAAALPALTASVAVDLPSNIAVAATLPALTALAQVTVTNGDPAGPIAATLPALSASVVVDSGITLDPWASGAHGEALLNLDCPTGVLEITYPAEPAPANIVEVTLQRASHQMPALTGVRAMDYDIVTDVVGTPHVWVDGVDVTYFRDVPCIIGAPREESPFGWTSATLTFPQVFHYEERGVGDLAWMRADAPVEIAIVTPLGGRIHKFTGQMASDDPGVGRGRTECTWQCEGILWQAEHAHHPVPARLAPTDVGTLIPDELNGTPSRRFAPFARVVTGILSRKRGSTRTKRWGYAADVLSTAIEDNGDMWTIEPTGPKSFQMALKDTTTVHWTISAGAPGVALDLSRDHHERIDAVYASGVGPDGYAWRNDFFPDLLPYDPPDYPYADPDDMVGIGSTDASTLTGTGISDWQRRIRDLGYTSLAVDGVINSADIAAVRWIQRKRGIQLDGVMGPQTWAASWNVGAVGGDLRTVRLPMAWRSEVEPWLYGANGATVGLNPDYDPSIIRHEIDVHLGENITKEQGREVCQRILERGMDPGIAGTITLTTCPWEGSRHEISAGDNVLLKGFQGDDVLMRVVALDPDWQAGDTPVRLTVDSEFRDAMAVLEILERNRESKADPARRPGNPNRRSRLDQDMVTPFEGESPAGRLPRMAIFEGLWTVWPVPVSEVGIIAKLRFQTTGPASRFAVALFGRPVTANQVAAKVPHPLSSSNPWADAGDSWLDAVGFIDAWGEEGQAAGYGMLGTEADGSPVTGELYDDAGVPYISQVSPWVWVGLYSPVSCYIGGRIYPDVVQ